MAFLSGLYEVSGTSSSSASLNFTMAGSLMQNGSSVAGILHFTSPSCFPFSTDIPASGTLTDTKLDVGLSLPSGQRLIFSNLNHPSPGGHPQFLAGTYSVIGPGCLPVDQGSISAGADFLSGPYVGTLTSSTSTSSHITLTLNQTGPDAHGLFSATGSATITGGTCFSSATIDPSTLLLGKGSTVVLDNSAPATTGKTVLTGDFFPSSPVGFGFFNGTYTSTQGACSESGTASLQL
jgi:hypothetical protein